MGYTKDTFIGFSWMSSFRVLSRIVAFFRIALLARLLSPLQFGIFGIASLILTLFETISQTGTSVYLIQERKKMEDYIDAAYVVSIIRGLILAFLILVSAPLISSYFNSPESLRLLRLVSLVAVIRGFINPSRIKFIKDLNFKNEFYINITVFLVDTTISIITTLLLKSSEGLVWGLVAGSSTELILSFIFIFPRPKLKIEVSKISDLFTRGKWVTGSTLFSYFFEQGDDLFVGKILGTASLGIYQAAYKISTLPITEIARVFNQVTFPVYTNLSDDKKRLKNAFFKVSITILVLTIPIGMVLYLYSYEITLLILGAKWLEVAPILKILSIFGIVRAIIVSTNPLFNSLKRQDLIAKYSFVGLTIMLLTIIPLTFKYGISGAAYSVLISSFATFPLIYYYLNRQMLK
jgi:lipopolysaccharide exporter